MKIYINGRFLTQKITGVQRHAREIVSAIDRLIDEEHELTNHEFILLTPITANNDMKLKHIKVKDIGNCGGHLWEQIILPWHTLDGFLINLCNCMPILKREQVVNICDAAVSAIPDAYTFMFKTWYKILFYCSRLSCKKIFTISGFSKMELNKYYGIKNEDMIVTYCGINHINNIKKDDTIIDRYNLGEARYVFAVSSINPSKNFQLVLKAAEKIPEVKFIIAGGMNSKVFSGNNWNVSDNAQFIGYVTDEELMALYEHAACFVYPSLYEGFGIPPLEAMMCGCPVIVSDRASLPEVCGDMAIYCDAYDENGLADKIKAVVFDNKGIVPDKEQLLDKYDWDKTAKVLLDNVLKYSSVKKRCE